MEQSKIIDTLETYHPTRKITSKMRVGAKKPARSDPASRPGPQKFLGGAAKSRAQPGKTRVSPLRLRCPAYKWKRLVGGHFIPRFLPPTTSPLPPRAAAGRRPRFRRKQPTRARRKAATRTRPPLPSPCVGGPPDLQICGTSSRAARFGFFQPPVAAPSDGVVGEPLPQPRQGRIAACRYGFVCPPPPKVCGHGLVRPSTGLGARAASLWLADAAHRVRRLHAESAAAHFEHAEAPRMGVLQMRKRRGTCCFHSALAPHSLVQLR